MSYEEEFDHIIRQKAESSEVPFEESGWNRMEKLLDQRKKDNRRALLSRWAIPAFITVLFLGIATLYFVPTVPNVQTIAQSEQTETIARDTELPGNKGAVTSDLKSDKVAPRPSQRHLNTKDPAKLKNVSTPGSDPVRNTLAAGEQPGEQHDVNLQTSTAPSNTSANMDPSNSHVGLSPGNNEEKVNHGNEDRINEQAPVTEETESEKEELVALPVADRLLLRRAFLPVNSNHELIPTFSPIRTEDYYSKKGSRFVNAEFGGTYLFGWKNGNAKDGEGFNWFAGLNAGTYLSNKAVLSGGFQLYNISNIEMPFFSMEEKQYGFGYTSTHTSITSSQLYYVSVPLRFMYAVSRRSILGAGVHSGYLVRAQSTLESYREEADGVRQAESAQEQNKIYEGTRSLNLMGSLMASTQVNSRLDISLEFVYGFTDLFENSAKTNNKSAERPIGLRLGMHYALLRK